MLRAFGLATAALAVTVSALSAGPASAAQPPTVAVAPHQYFQGLVNGQTSDATILMACFGPVQNGETGHPLGGQTIGVQLLGQASGAVNAYGYTGDTAGSIVALLVSEQASGQAVVAQFEFYESQALSTSLTLPCGGSAVIDFLPAPDSGGQPYAVTVQFVAQP